MTPAAGRLLVATPILGDPNFDRTVVLLLEHGEEGALGLVLNRPTATGVTAPFPGWLDRVAAPPVLFAGGPVAPAAAIGLARAGADGQAEGWAPLLGRLGTVDLAREPAELPVALEAVRVFAGYAGWGAGQLEGEIGAGAWFVVDSQPGDAFTPVPARLWRDVLRRQRGRLALFAHAPTDPDLN